ncbi:translation elongation factor Ts [Granulosicoccaceae sp. 1_MG-2023]|nr:translation elongation factor Ts [Granulosicoccaceae sp. 1_MG-2023]
MQITAAMVKELRERTGAGMMECKKALSEVGGDMEKAIEHMRITGLAKADKKSDRTAAEGVISIVIADDGKSAAMVEVNSETDFVAKGEDFQKFAANVSQAALQGNPADVEALNNAEIDGGSVDHVRKELVAKIGENLQVRRFVVRQSAEGVLNKYLHGERIGVLVELKGGDEALAKDIAMHIAASKPLCVDESGVPAETLEKEKAILVAEAEGSGKPAEIIEKMVQGRIRKYLAEITLVGQPFVKDPDQTVGKLLKSKGAECLFFARYEVGEGIEKKQENFADEVMAQVRGS